MIVRPNVTALNARREVFGDDAALAVLADAFGLEDQLQFADQLALALELGPNQTEINDINTHRLPDAGRVGFEVRVVVALENQGVSTRRYVICHVITVFVCFGCSSGGNTPRRFVSLGKRHKEFAAGESPFRAELAGASESKLKNSPRKSLKKNSAFIVISHGA